MRVTLEMDDTGEHADVDLPALPRIGEEVLWTVPEGATDDDGDPCDWMRKYRVRMVDWSLSSDTKSYFITVQLAYIADA
jgi:hypothetical protein